jgi:hypothetical protein
VGHLCNLNGADGCWRLSRIIRANQPPDVIDRCGCHEDIARPNPFVGIGIYLASFSSLLETTVLPAPFACVNEPVAAPAEPCGDDPFGAGSGAIIAHLQKVNRELVVADFRACYCLAFPMCWLCCPRCRALTSYCPRRVDARSASAGSLNPRWNSNVCFINSASAFRND